MRTKKHIEIERNAKKDFKVSLINIVDKACKKFENIHDPAVYYWSVFNAIDKGLNKFVDKLNVDE